MFNYLSRNISMSKEMYAQQCRMQITLKLYIDEHATFDSELLERVYYTLLWVLLVTVALPQAEHRLPFLSDNETQIGYFFFFNGRRWNLPVERSVSVYGNSV